MSEENPTIRTGDLVRWQAGDKTRVGVVISVNPDQTCTMNLQGPNGETVTLRISSDRLERIASTSEPEGAAAEVEAVEVDTVEAIETPEGDVEITETEEVFLTPAPAEAEAPAVKKGAGKKKAKKRRAKKAVSPRRVGRKKTARKVAKKAAPSKRKRARKPTRRKKPAGRGKSGRR